MKLLLTATLFLSAVVVSFSQKSPVKFGDIPMEDMKMTVYEQDSSAAAVVLLDYGEADFKEYHRHVRIKILKKNAFKWADVRVNLHSSQRLTKLKASTYNLEGGKIVTSEMADEGIFQNNVTDGLKLQTFTLPNVKEGSIIEYSFTLASTGISPPDWEFQKVIPVRWSEYWAIIPDFFVYRRYIQGYVQNITYEMQLKNMTSYEANAHHWIAKDVPAFRVEPFISCSDNYISKVNFALASVKNTKDHFNNIDVMTSWEKLGQAGDEFKHLISVVDLRQEVAKVTLGVTDSLQMINLCHAYIRDNMNWNNRSAPISKAPNLKKAWETKTGSSADINILLASILQEGGFKVKVILYSTRDHGIIRKEYPMAKQFNDVALCVQVNGKRMFLDATEKYLPYNMLPQRCLNGEGMLITRPIEWVDLDSKIKAKTTANAELSLNEKGELTGKISLIYSGYAAGKMRDHYFTKGEEKYKPDWLTTKDWKVDKIEFQNVKETTLPVSESVTVDGAEYGSQASGILYINPFVVSQHTDHTFKAETREYPVDYGNAIENLYVCKITLPPGYDIDELPPNAIFGLPGNAARYVYSITRIGDALSITRSVQINKTIFFQDEYPNLREFYNKVVAKEAEQIVLKKK
jgi:hypothetical protein